MSQRRNNVGKRITSAGAGFAGVFPTFRRFRHISIFLKKKGKDIEKREKEEKARNNVRNVRMSEKKLETRMDKRSTVSDIGSNMRFDVGNVGIFDKPPALATSATT